MSILLNSTLSSFLKNETSISTIDLGMPLGKIIKNVSSSTFHKKDLSFYLSSTFIYEPILIKIYMNANIMNTQIFHLKRSLKVTKVHRILTLTQFFPYWMVRWCFSLQIVCISLSLTLHLVLFPPSFSYSLSISLSISLFCFMQCS